MTTLPPLRSDLKLEGKPTWIDGQVVFLLMDPLSSHYYRIDKKTLVILQHWQQIDPDKLVLKLHALKYTDIVRDDIDEVLGFIINHQLVDTKTAERLDVLIKQKNAAKLTWVNWLIHNYLFFKVPLVKPDRFLSLTLPWVSKLFTRRYVMFMVGVLILGSYLTLQKWQEFFQPLDELISLQGALYLFVGISLVKSIHELGHAYALKYFGCHVPSIGIAFIVMFPILYTDASDSWRLHDPRKRLIIDLSGVISELHFMTWCLLLWHLTDNPILKNVITYALSIGLVSTLLINLNPLMRFDGYYALSSFLNIDNLQPRSFPLARWKLREWLLGLNEPPPIIVPQKKQQLMLIYAYSTWVYRFFLFLGIAVLVYFMFFKLLGILLFLVEIFYFIFNPIISELIVYAKHIKTLKINRNIMITGFFVSAALLILIVPWQTRLTIPAVLVFADKKDIYTELDCYALEVPFANEVLVQNNDMLFKCDSPELTMQQKTNQLKIVEIRDKLRQQQGLGQQLGPKQADNSELIALLNQEKNLLKQADRLTIEAPFAGFIFNRAPIINAPRWYADDTYLMSVASTNRWVIKAYASEIDIDRFKSIKQAFFLSNSTDTPPLLLGLLERPLTRAASLDNAYLSSVHGGTLSTYPPSQNQDEAYRLKPSVYPFVFSVQPSVRLNYEERGVVIVDVESRSIIKRLYLKLIGILVRESSF